MGIVSSSVKIVTRLVLLAAVQFATGASHAQSGAQVLFGVVGGMMQAARIQAAQEAWQREPELRVLCFERGLAKHNANIRGLISAGITPGDPRLSGIAAECARFEPSALKANYPCTITDENGLQARSLCTQHFARKDGYGPPQPIDVRTAMDLYFSNGSPFVVDFETDAGRQQRVERAEGQRRLTELMKIRSEVEAYRTSRSEVVRNQAQSLVKRIASISSPDSLPSEIAVQAIRQDAERLPQLATFELARLAALDQLNVVKSAAERRLSANSYAELQGEVARLRLSHCPKRACAGGTACLNFGGT